jgi:hypothetical protein
MKREWAKSTVTISASGDWWGTRNYLRLLVRRYRRGNRGRNVQAVLPPRKPPLIHNGRKP